MVSSHDVPPLDASEVMESWASSEQTMGFAGNRVSLFLLLAHVEESHSRTGAAENIPHVDASQIGEVHELPGRTVYVGPTVQHENRLIECRKERCDGGSLYAIVEAQENSRSGENGSGVSGRDKRVGAAGLLEAEPDDDAGVGFLA